MIAPDDVPSNFTLTLQLKTDGDADFSDYTSSVGAGQRVQVTGQDCAWYDVRWIAIWSG